MKTNLIKYLVSLAAFVVVSATFAENGGNCERNAKPLKSSQSVTLVAEYDPEEGDPEYRYDYDSGVAYYKINLAKGSECTVWIEGGDVADLYLDVGVSWDDENTYATFDATEEFSGGKIQAAYLHSDGWDEDDPPTATFYVCISGDVGQSTTLYYTSGIRTFTVTGEEDSPKSITIKDSVQSVSSKMVTEDGGYWFKVSLQPGRQYVFYTEKGTLDKPLDIGFDDFERLEVIQDEAYGIADVGDGKSQNVNAKYFVTATEKASYKFEVVGTDVGDSFTLKYSSLPIRKPADHPFVEMTSENVYTVAVVPGRLVATREWYDPVADETLSRIYLKKGERWAFRTSGSTQAIKMDIYNADGKVLVTNETLGNASLDCGVALSVPESGYYYVGVYDPLLEIGDETPFDVVTLTAVNCAEVAPADDYDPTDDVVAGATLVTAASGRTTSDIVATSSAFKSSGHRLDVGDWYDTFAVACRKGYHYRVRAVYDGEKSTDLSLAAKVFTVASGKETAVKSSGVLMPTSDIDSDFEFTGSDNALHYLRISVADGLGLDFPSYSIMVMAFKADDSDLGVLQVRTKGAEGKWYLGSEKKYYPNGAAVNVVGSQSITFSSVNGFATPAVIKTNVVAGASVTVVTGIYNDSYDRYQITKNKKKVWVSDDDASGAVALATTGGKVVSAPRTLWTTDSRDLFTFKAPAGVFYNFELADTTLDGVGDAVYTIEKDGVVVIGPTTEKQAKRVFDAGDYTVRVTHSNDAARVDSSYRLDYSTFNVGTIKFAAATYSAKESDEFVTLKLQRTAKEGVVRVRWATQQGTNEVAALNAMPGEEYYATNGVITWASGDKTDKKIKVRLIPDMVATVESNKSFTVCLSGMDPDDLADDEYPAQISRSVATVTLGEVTKKNAGTVTATAYGFDETPFANVKKPVMTVTAGDSADLVLSRSGYTALTKVALKVTAVADKKKYKDTAVKGVDFEEFSDIIEWREGDEDDQIVSIPTISRGDYTLSRQFTVTLTPVTTGAYKGWDKPKLTSSTVTVKISNETAVQSFSNYAKEMKSSGVSATAKGTWFKDSNGDLVSAEASSASVTFQVTGPGLLVVNPSVSGCGVLTCKIGSNAPFEWDGGEFGRIVPMTKKKDKVTSTPVVFSFKDEESTGAVTFESYEDGMPFKWIPFKEIVPVEPVAKSAVQSSMSCLSWTDQLKDEGMYYRVRFGTDKNPKMVLTNLTEETSCQIPAGTLVPSKTWYWTIDYARIAEWVEMSDEPSKIQWTPGPTVWTFTTVAEGATSTLVAGDDAFGNDYNELLANNEPIQLVQGVKADFEIGPETGNSSKSRVLAGELPPGLKLNGAAGKGTVTGVPTKAGEYTVVLQTALGTEKKPAWASSLTLRFVVNPIGTAVGSFRGTLIEDGSALELGAQSVGNLSFTTSTAGKLTAKATIAGKSYSFTGTGFDEVLEYDEGAEGVDKSLEAVLTLVQKTTNGKSGSAKKVTGVYTNELTVVMPDGALDNLQALSETKASVKLHMYVPNANATEVTETDYICDLYRDNKSVPEYKTLLAPYVGYYTAALVAKGVSTESGVPAGHGYLTLKVDSVGKVTVSGRLADGKEVSGSTVGTLSGDYCGDPQDCELLVPVYFGSTSYGFGGVLVLCYDSDALGPTTVFRNVDSLVWNKDGSSATEDGEGFRLDVVPAGGWYNTVVNLQRYYLNEDFLLDGIDVTLYGDTVRLASKKGETVKDLTYSIKRTTGLVSGTLTYSGTKKIKHYGVLPFVRDSASPLDDDIWTAGFFLHKVTKSWSESIPFDIRATDVDRDWSEIELGE